MADIVWKWDGFVKGEDVPPTPDDLVDAGWLLWATPINAQVVRRYYCRQLSTRRMTRTYADPDRAVAVVRRWIRLYTNGSMDHVG